MVKQPSETIGFDVFPDHTLDCDITKNLTNQLDIIYFKDEMQLSVWIELINRCHGWFAQKPKHAYFCPPFEGG